MSKTNPQKRYLSHSDKAAARKMLQDGESYEKVMRKFKISLSTCKRLKRNELKEAHADSRKSRTPLYQEADEYVWERCQELRSVGRPISGPMLQSMADEKGI